jgi:hypothetical protein
MGGQLSLLIRQYNLDANLVKLYAADFCGTATLSGASRELVESLSPISLPLLNRTEMLWSASSAPILNLRRQSHEATHSRSDDLVSNLDGLFLVRVERASYRWHPQKSFLALRFGILEPTSHEALSFSGRLYCTERALWKLSWFLRDFGYHAELLTREVDEKKLLDLRGVVRTSFTSLNGHSYQNLDAFTRAAEWETLACTLSNPGETESSHDDI